MTEEEPLAVALREVGRQLAADGFLDQLRAEVRVLQAHPSSAEGAGHVEVALANLAEQVDRRLEDGREDEAR